MGAILETVRLRNRAFNQWLIGRFAGIHREKELIRPSGIFLDNVGLFFDRPLGSGKRYCDRGHAVFNSGGRFGGVRRAHLGPFTNRQ